MNISFLPLVVLLTATSGSKITSGPLGNDLSFHWLFLNENFLELNQDVMVSDEVHDVPNPLQGVVDELTKNLTELASAYKLLCQEVFHLSRHVVFHEHALKHIAMAAHHHHGEPDHDHQNLTESENEISTVSKELNILKKFVTFDQ